MSYDNNIKQNSSTSSQSAKTNCCVPEPVQKEIDRIKRVATIYMELQSLMPNYESEYMDVFVEMANRFDAVSK